MPRFSREAFVWSSRVPPGVVAVMLLLLAGPTKVQGSAVRQDAARTFPDWPEAEESAKPWIRWWWPGSAVDEANLEAQLDAFAAAGLGGVEVTPIYGARGYEDRYVDFLSSRWMELLEHAATQAHRRGLGLDMATGTGWPFGGPWVEVEDAAKKLELEGEALELAPTGQQVKRAAPGGEGLVLDPFSAEAIGRYLARFDEAFADFPDGLLRSQFHDSFEYYGANGTEALSERFEALHGYRLEDWAEELLGENQADEDTIARLKGDYRYALDQLHQEYLRAWTEWAHAQGWKTRNQSHGAPANLLDLYAISDIPETEIFGSTPFPIPGLRREADAIRQGLDLPEPLVSRMASSSAHVMGKPLVSCETATWLRDHWKVALSHVKPELDRVLLDGINHVFYHGAVFSPVDAPWPGWLFYASTQFNPQNPWWSDFAALNAYVTRVQSVLQSGEPDNDVLLYWPVHDIWHDAEGLAKQLTVHHVDFVTEAPFGKLARRLREGGYAFDYVSDAQLVASSVASGKLATPGNEYAALVVPAVDHMPLETLRTLKRLSEAGGRVIFAEWPKDVPGLDRLEERRTELASLIEGLKSAPDGERPMVGDALVSLRRLEEVKREAIVESGLDFIRRRGERGWDYFLANLSGEAFDGWVALGVPARAGVFLEPLSGRGGVAAMRERNGVSECYLQLEPGESIALRTLADADAEGPAWPYLEASGTGIEVAGDWQVSFLRGGPTLPESYVAKELASWTSAGDPEAERFAGTARYEIEFELPETVAEEWILDLGELRESASVHVNGSYAGRIWSLPFKLRVGEWLEPGTNRLSIEVTNTAANRIRDMDKRGVDWKIMREINFVDINYKPFDASGWDVQPSGLLGPVRLIPQRFRDPGSE